MTASTDSAAEIRGRLDFFADEVVTHHFLKHPDLAARYGDAGRVRCREDARFHFSYLASALDLDTADIFVEYVAWAKTVLVARRIAAEDLDENLAIMEDVVRTLMRPDLAAPAAAMVAEARSQLGGMPATVDTFIDTSTDSGSLAKDYLNALMLLDSRGAIRVIADALLRSDIDVRAICCDVLEPVQHEIGRLWQLNLISVAVEHFCSSVTQQLIAQFATFRRANPDPGRKRIVAMCAPGELHEIGLRAITEVLSLDGWNIIHLGANTPAVAAVQMCIDQKAEVILVSATLPPHVAGVMQVVHLVRAAPELSGARVYVGGRVFAGRPELWRMTGADGSAPSAAALAKLISEGRQ
jgi:methanogenic corrinoid protein MtbC1